MTVIVTRSTWQIEHIPMRCHVKGCKSTDPAYIVQERDGDNDLVSSFAVCAEHIIRYM